MSVTACSIIHSCLESFNSIVERLEVGELSTVSYSFDKKVVNASGPVRVEDGAREGNPFYGL